MLIESEVIIDEDTMEELKEVAVEKGRSLEETIDRYMYFVTEGHKKLANQLSPDLASLRGKYKVPAGFNWKDAVSEELLLKYTNR